MGDKVEIREVYNNDKELPDISPILSEMGFDENHKMFRIATGMSSDVFDAGQGMIVKVTNIHNLEKGSEQFLNSKYVLQPISVHNLSGEYYVALYPKLNTKDVNIEHVNFLRERLKEEGYNFDDDRIKNVGLDELGNPYVIDPDAITKLVRSEEKQENEKDQSKKPDTKFHLLSFLCPKKSNKEEKEK